MNTDPTVDFRAEDCVDPMDIPATSNRRDFMKRLGGGIFIFVSLSELVETVADAASRKGVSAPADFNAYLRIGEDGRVTCYTGKIEMGQGPITSLPQEVAEELDMPVELVDIVMSDTDLCPDDGGTFGSGTTRNTGQKMRAAAAEARGVLLELAAENLNVPQSQLTAKDGVIMDQRNKDHKVSYAQLAKGKKIERRLTTRPPLKGVADLKVIGKPQTHRDGRLKVTGQAKYSGDFHFPGMLHAKILRPPAHGAKLKSVDTDPAAKMAGVRVIDEGDFVAVLHEFPDVAEEALSRIKAEFDPSPSTLDDKNIYDHILATSTESNGAPEGDLDEGRKLAVKKFDATYLGSYVAHSPMEPHVATAMIENGKATVWASTQGPISIRDQVARAIGFDTANVRVIAPFVGGGFGGKGTVFQASEAARLAKAVGKPVQVMASRETEFYDDTFRPASVIKISSGLDASGKIVLWDYAVYCAGSRGAAQFYSVPHHRTAIWDMPRGNGHPFGTGAWRAPGNSNNTFARESHIDAMAAAAGVDPVEFRLNHLTDSKLINVLKTTAQRFGWKPAKAPSKRGAGFGVAMGQDAGTDIAAMAEVEVDAKKGAIKVKRIVCVQDMGLVINPAGARIQMEGSLTMGLGYALTEEVHFKNGKILDTNYDTYEIPRFSWVPRIEAGFVESQSASPQGGGEPAIIVVGAVIANAIFDATGARLLRMPMTPERVKAALQKA